MTKGEKIGIALKKHFEKNGSHWTGRKQTPEHVEKRRLANSGRVVSEESRRRMSLGKMGNKSHLGHLHSEATKALLARRKGAQTSNWRGGVSLRPGYLPFMSHQRRQRLAGACGRHTFQEWEELRDKYDHTCLACRRKELEIILTQDHIVPLSKGGSNDITNIQPLCKSCNSKKHAKTIDYRPIKSESLRQRSTAKETQRR